MSENPPPGWNLHPKSRGDWELEQYFADDGKCIATVERSNGESAMSFPRAFDPIDKLWKRGGAFKGKDEAKLWAERIAGVSPPKPGEFTGTPSRPVAGVHPATRMRG